MFSKYHGCGNDFLLSVYDETLDYSKINNRPLKLTDLNNTGFTLSANSLTNLNNL